MEKANLLEESSFSLLDIAYQNIKSMIKHRRNASELTQSYMFMGIHQLLKQ